MNLQSLLTRLCAFLVITLPAPSRAADAKDVPAIPRARGMAFCGGVVMIPVQDTAPQMRASLTGAFQIETGFNPNVTPAQKVVIQQAVNEWVAIIQSSGVTPSPYLISFLNGPLAESELAICDVSFGKTSGDLRSAAITINEAKTFYVDATPADDSDDPELEGKYDLLTVLRHEIGHAVGWSGTPRVTDLIGNNVFDAGRLNIGVVLLVSADNEVSVHCDADLHPDELMGANLDRSERKAIQLYPSAALVARAFGYQIPMQFVDPFATGTESGTAAEPWHSFTSAINQAPPDVPLLLAPQAFQVAPQAVFSARHSVFSARGGAAVLAP